MHLPSLRIFPIGKITKDYIHFNLEFEKDTNFVTLTITRKSSLIVIIGTEMTSYWHFHSILQLTLHAQQTLEFADSET